MRILLKKSIKPAILFTDLCLCALLFVKLYVSVWLLARFFLSYVHEKYLQH